MALTADIRKSVTDATPVLALVGVTDLAVEKLRAARAELEQVNPADLQAQLTEQAQHVPAQVLGSILVAAGRAADSYEVLAERGGKLVTRLRKQQSTKDLIAQAGTTVSLGKGAVTTVRRAAQDTQRVALATLGTALRETDGVVTEVADSAKGAARDTAVRSTRTAAARTRTAAKRGSTTTRTRATTTRRATKAATTSARKTATKAAKATEAGAANVGD